MLPPFSAMPPMITFAAFAPLLRRCCAAHYFALLLLRHAALRRFYAATPAFSLLMPEPLSLMISADIFF
jgi:hypothetical protein